jgi:hypothetical protein
LTSFLSPTGRLLFERYEDVPPLIVESLLFIEDRELLQAGSPRHNPALNWERLSKAWLLYGGRVAGLPLAIEGGSTLATQIEKFRHSPGGRTSSPLDKLQQVTAASLKAYRSGSDTRAYRRDVVVVTQLVPLAALTMRSAAWASRPGFGIDLPTCSAASRFAASPCRRSRTKRCSPCSAPCASRRASPAESRRARGTAGPPTHGCAARRVC